jgi:hypothetical protein
MEKAMRWLVLLLAFIALVSADFVCRCQNTDNNICTTSADCTSTLDECLCVDEPAQQIVTEVVVPSAEVHLSAAVTYTTWESVGIIAGLFAAVFAVLLVGVYLEYIPISWNNNNA